MAQYRVPMQRLYVISLIPSGEWLVAATGHTLEFLTFALDKKRLQEPWVQKAVVYMCDLLDRTKHIDLECGGLYHAVHGLVLYREKVFGPREGEPRPSGAGELASGETG